MSARRAYAYYNPLRLPKPNTRLRRIYDLLLTGERIDIKGMVGGGAITALISCLTDYYNCELDRLASGYVMRGRWSGQTLVPIERLNHLGDPQPA